VTEGPGSKEAGTESQPPAGSTAPLVYLLAGLTGSGKTTFAKDLEAAGVVRLSVDEEVFARHGRHGIDYPEREYPARERPVVEHTRQRLVELIQAGHSVVLDYGLWRRRDANALTITAATLDEFIARFESPSDEGEEIIQP
jgi:predicted kinase